MYTCVHLCVCVCVCACVCNDITRKEAFTCRSALLNGEGRRSMWEGRREVCGGGGGGEVCV